MGRGKKKRVGQCVFCGGPSGTEEHVFPRALFAKSPKNPIVVYACRDCNELGSSDIEYFRAIIAAGADAYLHEEAKGAWAAHLRALRHPKKAGFAKQYLRSIEPVLIKDQQGAVIGGTFGYAPDRKRIDSVLDRIIRGLIYHHTKKIWPADEQIDIFWPEDRERLLELFGQDIAHYFAFANAGRKYVIGENTVVYKVRALEDGSGAIAWRIEFYESIRFLCVSGA